MAEYHTPSHRVVSVFSLMRVSLMLYVSLLIELAVCGLFFSKLFLEDIKPMETVYLIKNLFFEFCTYCLSLKIPWCIVSLAVIVS